MGYRLRLDASFLHEPTGAKTKTVYLRNSMRSEHQILGLTSTLIILHRAGAVSSIVLLLGQNGRPKPNSYVALAQFSLRISNTPERPNGKLAGTIS
jgi:hypothetical protein